MKQNKYTLSEPGDRTVFKMPENYFESFEAALEKRLDALEKKEMISEEPIQTETKSRKFILNMETIRPVLYMAAMFILLIFSISLVLKFTSNSSSSLRLSAESTKPSTSSTVPTAEDYLINSIGTYGITEYYVDSQSLE